MPTPDDSKRTKVIAAGSRDLLILTEPNTNPVAWLDTILCTAFQTLHPHNKLEIVSGGSGNMDKLGERWAIYNDAELRVFKVDEADWKKHGKAAGPIRNRQMAEYADALVLIWDGKSRGSKNMLEEAQKRGLRVIEVRFG